MSAPLPKKIWKGGDANIDAPVPKVSLVTCICKHGIVLQCYNNLPSGEDIWDNFLQVPSANLSLALEIV